MACQDVREQNSDDGGDGSGGGGVYVWNDVKPSDRFLGPSLSIASQ